MADGQERDSALAHHPNELEALSLHRSQQIGHLDGGQRGFDALVARLAPRAVECLHIDWHVNTPNVTGMPLVSEACKMPAAIW